MKCIINVNSTCLFLLFKTWLLESYICNSHLWFEYFDWTGLLWIITVDTHMKQNMWQRVWEGMWKRQPLPAAAGLGVSRRGRPCVAEGQAQSSWGPGGRCQEQAEGAGALPDAASQTPSSPHS